MLLDLIKEQDNNFSAHLDALRRNIEVNIMSSIWLNEVLEKRIEREMRLLKLKIEFMEKHLNHDPLATPETYNQEINQLKQNFIDNYGILLGARDSTYDLEKKSFVKLDDNNRRDYLNLFIEIITQKTLNYLNYNLTTATPAELENQRSKLNKLEGYHGIIFNEKTLLAQTYHDAYSALERARRSGMVDVKNHNPLVAAVERREIEHVGRLINQQRSYQTKQSNLAWLGHRLFNTVNIADYINTPDMAGVAAIHVACNIGTLECSRVLVVNGANVNLKSSQGLYPVHYTVEKENPNMVATLRLLYENRADMHIKGDYDRTALHTAAHFGNLQAIKVLITTYHLKVNSQETLPTRYTPLHSAARKDNGDAVKLLIQLGASPLIKNANDETALYEAVDRGCMKSVRAFTEMGIKLSDEEKKALINDANFARKPWLPYALALGSAIESGYAPLPDNEISDLMVEMQRLVDEETIIPITEEVKVDDLNQTAVHRL